MCSIVTWFMSVASWRAFQLENRDLRISKREASASLVTFRETIVLSLHTHARSRVRNPRLAFVGSLDLYPPSKNG